MRLFGEEITPVCSPSMLKDRLRPLKTPADLRHHTLLHFEDATGVIPWLELSVWLESAGFPVLKPADALRFSHYDQAIRGALAGQGVALGRCQLIGNLIADGSLVAPFRSSSVTDRAYYLVRTPATRSRGEVDDFVSLLTSESAGTTNARERPPKGRARPPDGP